MQCREVSLDSVAYVYSRFRLPVELNKQSETDLKAVSQYLQAAVRAYLVMWLNMLSESFLRGTDHEVSTKGAGYGGVWRATASTQVTQCPLTMTIT